MQFRHFLSFCLTLVCLVQGAFAQIVFNKTEHDFGSLAKQSGYFEQDFIFRNTGDEKIKMLSVKSVQPALSFIFTRSEVLKGEYGFVKVKINTDSLTGLFHDQAYITMRYGDDVKSEVLYLRANINDQGKTSDQRQFEDGSISTSVEVSPNDIETMEGFMGGDKLTQAQSEISYLKKQVDMKSELIAKLSDDLFKKQEQESENFNRLAKLEETLKENSNKSNVDALSQLDELTTRLLEMRHSDSILRNDISIQESQYQRLKHEADSARNFAETLSAQLKEKFKSEALAMERAQQLEKDLKQKELTEQQQQAKIDSLNRVLRLSKDNNEVKKEIKILEQELKIRKKEQLMQDAFVAEQSERINALKAENEFMKRSADSLANEAENSASENEQLQQRLAETSKRVSSYESKIDSLQVKASDINNAEQASIAELDSLKRALEAVENRDEKLKQEISSREDELNRLQAERDLARKNMSALERATTKQQEQAHELMYRLNGLAKKESEAQIEVSELKLALKESQYREDSTRQSVSDLVQRISEKESSIEDISNRLSSKESELNRIKEEQQETTRSLQTAQSKLNKSDAQIDSLKNILATKNDGASMLENDIEVLHKQVLESQRKQKDYQVRSEELKARLDNAYLSNDLTFQELKADIDAISAERDAFKSQYKSAQNRVDQLEQELIESKRNEESAIAFANEFTTDKPTGKTKVTYSVNLVTSDEPLKMGEVFKRVSNVKEYKESNSYRYIVGEEKSFQSAIDEKEKMKAQGFPLAFIVAFKDGKRISLKEALEAQK